MSKHQYYVQENIEGIKNNVKLYQDDNEFIRCVKVN